MQIVFRPIHYHLGSLECLAHVCVDICLAYMIEMEVPRLIISPVWAQFIQIIITVTFGVLEASTKQWQRPRLILQKLHMLLQTIPNVVMEVQK